MPVSGLPSFNAFPANSTPGVSSPAPATASFPLLEQACQSNHPLPVCHPLWPEGKYISISPDWLRGLWEKMTLDEKQGMEDILHALKKGAGVKDIKKYPDQGHVEFKLKLPQIRKHVAFSYEGGDVTYLGAKDAQPGDENDFFVEKDMRIDTDRIMERTKRTAPHSPPPSAAVMQMVKRPKTGDRNAPSSSHAEEGREDVESIFYNLTKAQIKQRNEQIWSDFQNQMLEDADVQEVQKLKPAVRKSVTYSHTFSQWAAEEDWPLDLISLSPKGRKDAVKARVEYKLSLTEDERDKKKIGTNRRNLKSGLTLFVTFLNKQYPDTFLPYASSREEARRFTLLGEDVLRRRTAVFQTAADNNEEDWQAFKQSLRNDTQKDRSLESDENTVGRAHTFSKWAAEEAWPLNLRLLSPKGRKDAIEAHVEYKFPWSQDEEENKNIQTNRHNLRNRLTPFVAFLNEQYPDAFLPYASNWEDALAFESFGEDQLKQWAADFNTAVSNNKESSLAFEEQVLKDANVERIKDLKPGQSRRIYAARSFSDSATKEGRAINLSSLSPKQLDKEMEAYLERNYSLKGEETQDKQIKNNKSSYRSFVTPFLNFLKKQYIIRLQQCIEGLSPEAFDAAVTLSSAGDDHWENMADGLKKELLDAGLVNEQGKMDKQVAEEVLSYAASVMSIEEINQNPDGGL